VRHPLLLDQREADFDRRRFRHGDPNARARLTSVALTFIDGYNAAWQAAGLEERFEALDPSRRGFAFEGAAMAMMLGDVLLPWRRPRWSRFVTESAAPHVYLALVGAGWAYARLGLLRPRFARLDPLLRWLVFDGCGFHDAFFHPERAVRAQRRSRRARGVAAPVYDQGVGRALWFVECADARAVAATIAAFESGRRGDLWAGAGLAATYAGGCDAGTLRDLRRLASGFETHLAQGAAFAATARVRAATVTPECETAVHLLSGCASAEAATITDRAAAGVTDPRAAGAYETWRGATRRALGARREVA
jgi:hypothetical protein